MGAFRHRIPSPVQELSSFSCVCRWFWELPREEHGNLILKVIRLHSLFHNFNFFSKSRYFVSFPRLLCDLHCHLHVIKIANWILGYRGCVSNIFNNVNWLVPHRTRNDKWVSENMTHHILLGSTNRQGPKALIIGVTNQVPRVSNWHPRIC